MTPGRRAFWVSALAGTAVLIGAYAAMLFYSLEFPTPHVSRAVLRLIPLATLILAGAVSALLAWRLGALRCVRLAAGLSPVVIVLGLVLYVYLRFTRRFPLPPVALIEGVVNSVWKDTLYLLVGTVPFLLPRDRERGARSH